MGSLIKRSNGVFYGVFTVKGKRVWRSTGSLSLEDAQQRYAELSRDFAPVDRLTILEFRESFLPLLEGRLAPATLRLYDSALRKFAEVLGNRKLRAITALDVESFLAKRLQEVSPSKVNIDFSTLKAAFGRAVRYRMIPTNPFCQCKKVRIPEAPLNILSREELGKLLNVVEDDQLRAIIVLAVCTAMRLGELAHLRWDAVDTERGHIRLENREGFYLKSRKGRIVPLNKTAVKILSNRERTSEYVFNNRAGKGCSPGWISKCFKAAARKAGLPPHIHFHSLRHTGASWMVQEGAPLTFVQLILGHSSVTTTMIYAHATSDHLRHSVERTDWLFEDDSKALLSA
jgi:integrase